MNHRLIFAVASVTVFLALMANDSAAQFYRYRSRANNRDRRCGCLRASCFQDAHASFVLCIPGM
jgi:hypothetical protein